MCKIDGMKSRFAGPNTWKIYLENYGNEARQINFFSPSATERHHRFIPKNRDLLFSPYSLRNYQSQCNCNNRRVGDEFSERSVLHSSLRTTAIMDWPMRIRTKRMDRTGLFVIGGAFQIGILLHSAKSLWSIGILWQKENDIWKGKIGRIGHLPIWFVIIQSERITDWRSLPFSLRPDQGTKNNPALNQSHNSSGMALGRLKNTIFPNLNKYPGGED